MTIARSTPILWGETWVLALQALRANKFRAMLTMLGVIIGSACIVIVVTVALAGKGYIIAQIEGVGANLIYGWSLNNGADRLSDRITAADLDALKVGIPQVVETAGTKDEQMTMVVNGLEHSIHMVGVTQGFEEIRKLIVLRGRYFDHDDMSSRSKVCLITESLAALVFPHDNPVGKEIRVEELYFTVIGVFKERVGTFGQSEITPESVIIPFALFKEYTGSEYFRTFYAQADRSENVSAVTAEVVQILQSRHRLGAKYHVENLSSILKAAKNISLALTVLLILVALIALTISGIGIMNIMLVTVTERTREIGIRRAIGAPRDAILYQFLTEALMISGTGAFLGILIGIGIPILINFLIGFYPEAGNINFPISWVSVVLAFVVSCSTGLVFGYLPAKRAAGLQPTESLRYE